MLLMLIRNDAKKGKEPAGFGRLNEMHISKDTNIS